MATSFLRARWQDLLILSYAVPRELLLSRLPAGLELDTWQGQAFVSLVAFDFRGCRVRGVGVPGCINFPEINLRFYVREPGDGGRRGVVFIREFVPSLAVALVARVVYNEPYRAAAMRSQVVRDAETISVTHDVKARGAGPLTIRARAQAEATIPGEDTAEHFFKEHAWGFGSSRGGRTLVYEVQHPRWKTHRVQSAEVVGDVAGTYGDEWSFIGRSTPQHALLAAGSEIEVFGHAPHARTVPSKP